MFMSESRNAARAARGPARRSPAGSGALGAGTRERLLVAAAEVFAARGYRGATMREIAERAEANLASAHYHFGSKENLYLEILRRQFDAIERRLGGARLRPPDAKEGAAQREGLERVLAARVRALLELLLDSSNRHGLLMQRELSDPSDALRLIVKRFVDPLRRDMDRLVAALAPGLAREHVERCSRSIIAQIYFYLSHRPVLLQLMGRTAYPHGFAADIADHISRFSLGGIDAIAAAAAAGAAPRRGRLARRGAA